MQTGSLNPSKILLFSESQTLKKIIEYSLEGSPLDLEHRSHEKVPKPNLENCDLIVFDGSLLASSLAEDWEDFLLQVNCPVVLLDAALEPKPALLKTPTRRRVILAKPFEREHFLRSVKSLGLNVFAKAIQHGQEKKSEEVFDAHNLSSQFQEQIRKEALAFVSDYCKSHFRSIAEEILTKEIRRLADERNSFLDEG